MPKEEIMEKIAVNISILFKARKKYEKCDHSEIFFGVGGCKLFNYTFDGPMDMLHHCGCCKANTKEPTITKIVARNP